MLTINVEGTGYKKVLVIDPTSIRHVTLTDLGRRCLVEIGYVGGTMLLDDLDLDSAKRVVAVAEEAMRR